MPESEAASIEINPEEQPVLHLPEDEYRVKQLIAKLEEYETRFEQAKTDDKYRHPDLVESPHETMKRYVLKTLLEQREFPAWDQTEIFIKEHGPQLVYFFGDNEEIFLERMSKSWNSAVGIIKDYCETGGKNTIGGTGLPEVEKE